MPGRCQMGGGILVPSWFHTAPISEGEKVPVFPSWALNTGGILVPSWFHMAPIGNREKVQKPVSWAPNTGGILVLSWFHMAPIGGERRCQSPSPWHQIQVVFWCQAGAIWHHVFGMWTTLKFLTGYLLKNLRKFWLKNFVCKVTRWSFGKFVASYLSCL